jgi:peptide/nickel transport system permease protein
MALTPLAATEEDVAKRRGMLAALVSPFRETSGLARWILVIGMFITAAFVVCAIFAPWIAPYSFDQTAANGVDFPRSAPPGGDHPFGTSYSYYDVLSRTIWGARTAIEVVILAIIMSTIVGVVLGLISGFVGGWLDRVLVLIMDSMFVIPSLLLAIVAGFLFYSLPGGSIVAAAFSITVVYIPQYFRVVRNTTVSAREATYVEAAHAIGAPGRTVVMRYIFPNVVHSVPVIGTLNAADAVGTLAALGFLGLGIQPNEAAEWGYDLQRALPDVSSDIWWTTLFPGLALILLITGLTLVGEGINETVNPTLRKRRLRKVVLPPRETDTTKEAS